jgi:hypothetical protein
LIGLPPKINKNEMMFKNPSKNYSEMNYKLKKSEMKGESQCPTPT